VADNILRMHRTLLLIVIVASASGVNAAGAQEAAARYRDSRAPIDVRVRDLLGRMTLEEKFWQLFMLPGDLSDSTHDWSHGVFGLQVRPRTQAGANAARFQASAINDIQRYFVERTRLSIPMLAFEEAVHGLLADGATMFPQAIALAATWDTALLSRVATAIARETRSRGVRQVLSPVVNIATDQRWGRVEETYGEDPVLTSRMAEAFVSAFEQQGVIATPKHFVANVGEGGRDSYPIDVNRRLLEELHYPPFRAALRAGARSVMTAYNAVDGLPATQNDALLNGVLKRDWKFSGFVISDAAATGGATVLHRTEASTATATRHALESGLDVIFQTSWPQHRPYLAAFRNAGIPAAVIDSAVARVLRAKFQLGLFEQPYVNVDSAEYWSGRAEHRALARAAARASIVLLRNERAALPLSRSVRSIAVIGTDAVEARLGGYSGPGIRPVSILDGVRAAVGTAVDVRYAPGPGRLTREYDVVPPERLSYIDSTGRALPGLRGEYFDNNALTGSPKVVRIDPRIDFGWTFNAPAPGISTDWYSVRWSGRITAPPAGVRRLGVEGNDGYRLFVDGVLAIDNWSKRSYGAHLADVRFTPGSSHELRLQYRESTGNARVKLVWDTTDAQAATRSSIDTAVTLARRSAVALVVAGIEEGEFRDRARLSLPGAQEELIERVAATGTPTVVVLVGGSAITGGNWLNKVGAVINAWYPGEEGGNAVADVLFGDYNPAGRLPMTWPIEEGQLPLVYNHKPTGRGDDYLDLTGQPLFPFGFGLSYTTFEYSALEIGPWNGAATVRMRVKNSGTRAGDEVVQLYVRDLLASVARPVLQLQGFRRVHLAPGEERQVTFTLGREELQLLNAEMQWVVEPGTFRIYVGSSSKDIRLRGDLVVR
jgi:beta-glucosidase